MTLTATFDPIVSRVRLAADSVSVMNLNPFFETNASDWSTSTGTFVRSTAQFHQGAASGLFTPNGVAATGEVLTPQYAITGPGASIRGSGWMRCANARNVNLNLVWFTSGAVFISASTQTIAVAANTWTSFDFTAVAPATAAFVSLRPSMTGTPPAGHLLYIDEMRMQDTVATVVQRSKNNIYWTDVRGGSAMTPTATDTIALDDYEFEPNVINYYRVVQGAETFTANVTPAQTADWIKSITRPFLNRAVIIEDHSDITRPARNGVFEVVGRSYPVAVTDVRSSRRWEYVLKAETVADADALEFVFASGDPLYFQIGSGHDIPGGYVVAGDVTRSRFGRISTRRHFNVPVTEVSPPASTVVGATSTWETLVAEYGTWTAVLAAFGTWADVMEHVASPDVVIVP